MRIVLRMKTACVRLWKDESGASLLEYSVLIGLITAAAVASISGVGTWVKTQWTTLESTLTTDSQ